MHTYLTKAAKAYYEGTPFLTDAEFDYLAKVNNFNQLGSPPLREGTIPHLNRLYSLDKYYENDKLPFNIYADVIPTPKLDGSAISLTYVDGTLSTAATRGDGFIGEDVSANFKAWDKIPQVIDIQKGIVQIIGEIVAPKTIENARNYAAGAARLKDPEEFLSRNIEFVVYHIFKNSPYACYSTDLQKLKKLGFITVLAEGIEDIYPTDGIVYRVESNEKYKDLGFTSKHPKGAFALKDSSSFESKETELLEVKWQIGKSGKVTPVAIFEPIVIEDATVSRATLHNAGFIEDMDLYIGDTIIITRAGGIIPKVLGKINT